MMPQRRILVITSLIVVAWVLFSCLAAPSMVSAIYRGEGPAFLALRGANSNPLEFYLRKWMTLATTVGSVLLIVGILVSFPAVRSWISGPASWTPPNLSRSKRLVVNGAVLSIIGIGLLQVLLGRDDYPFSSYPMYSSVRREFSQKEMRLFGVTEQGHEIHLATRQQLYPFAQDRMKMALKRMDSRADAGKDILSTLEYVFQTYERRRVEGDHGGILLTSVRLYEMEWDLLADASNISTPRTKRLVSEYTP